MCAWCIGRKVFIDLTNCVLVIISIEVLCEIFFKINNVEKN